MRLLLLAGLHLGARAARGGKRAAIGSAQRARAWSMAVERVLDPALGIHGLVTTGDLFDRPDPSAEVLSPVADGLARIAEAGKAVVLLPGARDGFSRPECVYSSEAVPPGAAVVDFAEPRAIEISVAGRPLPLTTFTSFPGGAPRDLASCFAPAQAGGPRAALLYGDLAPGPAAPAPGGAADLLSWARPSIERAWIEASGLDLVIVGGGADYFETRWGRTLVVQPGGPEALVSGANRECGLVIAELDPAGVQLVREPLPLDPEAASGPEPSPADGEAAREAAAWARREGGVLALFAETLEGLAAGAADGEERSVYELALRRGLEEFRRTEARRVG